jgi:hypothetical protein
MIDLAQERKRLEELDRYGVKTARQWNEWQEEWDRQHPREAKFRRVAGSVALFLGAIICWLPVIVPVVYYLKGVISGT